MNSFTDVSLISRKRRNSESKPISQVNKCENEKRRREQENHHYEELADLISASFEDMSSLSVKLNKCAILEETVNQIRRIKHGTTSEGTCGETSSDQTCDAVQQSDVSSSKPTILANEVLGPLLLEALDGFLFLVNSEGKIEFVSENVSHFLNYTEENLLGNSIYNIIHVGDHGRFSSTLFPMALVRSQEHHTQSKNKIFTCRLLIKPPDEEEETMEEKQQRVMQYETMQISAILSPYPRDKSDSGEVSSADATDHQNYLLCVARRIPPTEKVEGNTVEQFTTRLDMTGKITNVDTSGVSSTYSQYLNKDLIGCMIQEVCHSCDWSKLTLKLKEAIQVGTSNSGVYKFRVAGPDKYIHVQTKFKHFPRNAVTQESEFIMATHSIVGDFSNSGSSSSVPKDKPLKQVNSISSGPSVSFSNHESSSPNPSLVTGPLTVSSPSPSPHGAIMMNDTLSSSGSCKGGSTSGGLGGSKVQTDNDHHNVDLGGNTSFTTLALHANDLNLGDFSLDLFPSSTWEINSGEPVLDDSSAGQSSSGTSDILLGQGSSWSHASVTNSGAPTRTSTPNSIFHNANISRPSSRQSSTSTPHPPSVSTYSPVSAPASQIISSPVGIYSQSSPVNTNVSTPYSSHSFSFSPFQENNEHPPHISANYSGQYSSSDSNLEVHNSNHSSPFAPSVTVFNNDIKESKDKTLGDSEGEPSFILRTVVESGRLRNLLTQRHSDDQSNSLVSDGGERKMESYDSLNRDHSENQILKVLLNQDDNHTPGEDRFQLVNQDQSVGGNNMLLQLLNERNDDDDIETKAGMKKKHELLQQLLRDRDESSPSGHGVPIQDISQRITEENLLRHLGIETNSPPAKQLSLKRRCEETFEVNSGSHMKPLKRSLIEVSSANTLLAQLNQSPQSLGSTNIAAANTTGSKLWEKNKMLASLLSKQPIQNTVATTANPNPKIVSQTPQEKLPKDLDKKIVSTPVGRNPNWSGPNTLVTSNSRSVLQNQLVRTVSSQFTTNQKTVHNSSPSPNTPNISSCSQPNSSFLNALLSQPITQEVRNNPNFQTLNQTLSNLANERGAVASSGLNSVQQVNNVNVNVNLNLNVSQTQGIQQTNTKNVNINEFGNIYGNSSNQPNSNFGHSSQHHSVNLVTSGGMNPSEHNVSDPLLSDILDQVLELNFDPPVQAPQQDNQSILKQIFDEVIGESDEVQPDINEKLAINAIQKSLESCETVSVGRTGVSYSNSNLHDGSDLGSPTGPGHGPNYSGPPPLYSQHSFANPHIRVANTNAYSLQSASQVIQRKQKLLQTQQTVRLLHQRRQQLMMAGVSGTTGEVSAGQLPNLEELLNNTVAPNVTLQHATGVSEAQLSPNYGNPLLNNLPSPRLAPQPQQPSSQQQQQPYSPHAQLGSPLAQQSFASSNAMQGNQSQMSTLPTYQQQLSMTSHTSPSAVSSWSGPSVSRPSLQQQNPMLNAQLSVNSIMTASSLGGTEQQHHRPPPSFRNNQFGNSAQPQGNNRQQLPPLMSIPLTSPNISERGSPYSSPNLPVSVSGPNTSQASVYTSHQMRTQKNILALSQAAGNSNSMTSEFVRQELRAMVGARTQQQQQQQQSSPPTQYHRQIVSTNNHNMNGHSIVTSQVVNVQIPNSGQTLSIPDLDDFPISLDLPSSGDPVGLGLGGSPVLDSPKSMFQVTVDDSIIPRDQKKSLLQQLLSE